MPLGKLAIVMHRIWSDGTELRWTREEAAAWPDSPVFRNPLRQRNDVREDEVGVTAL